MLYFQVFHPVFWVELENGLKRKFEFMSSQETESVHNIEALFLYYLQ